MSTQYTVIVENNSPNAQEFFFFQQPAVYSGGAKVYTNSVGHGSLPPYNPQRKSQIEFALLQQYYAGVQRQSYPPVVGQVQTGLISQVVIDIAPQPPGKASPDGTTVVIGDDSLYLDMPVVTSDVQPGAFRITTPPYAPSQHLFNVGLSTINNDGEVLLSNFISGEPSKNTDVQPIVKFYVNTGSYKPGTVVNFTTTSVNAALCDATYGALLFHVTYNADGTWTVK